MFRAYCSRSPQPGWRLVMLAGLATFAASFGVLIVFATGWVAAVIPTISETVLTMILAALIAQFAMSLTHALLTAGKTSRCTPPSTAWRKGCACSIRRSGWSSATRNIIKCMI